jgi:hypothetical protein
MAAEKDRNGEISNQGKCPNCSTTTAAKEHSFDRLAMGLADVTLSRRKALRMLGGALVGAVLASGRGAALADTQCKPLSKKCNNNTQCCSGNCIENPQGGGKVCGCAAGSELCGGQCLAMCPPNAQRDPQLCECVCPSGFGLCASGSTPGSTLNCCESGTQQCCKGECYPFCPEGEVRNGFTCQCEAACVGAECD